MTRTAVPDDHNHRTTKAVNTLVDPLTGIVEMEIQEWNKTIAIIKTSEKHTETANAMKGNHKSRSNSPEGRRTEKTDYRENKNPQYPSRGAFGWCPIVAGFLVLESVEGLTVGAVVLLVAAGANFHGDRELPSINDCSWPVPSISRANGFAILFRIESTSWRMIVGATEWGQREEAGKKKEGERGDVKKVEIFGWSECRRWEWGL